MPPMGDNKKPGATFAGNFVKVRRTWKRKFQTLHNRLEWFHYEKRERSYLLRVFGRGRIPKSKARRALTAGTMPGQC
jgi:hypothetical protein